MQDVLIRAEQYQNLSMKKSQAHYDAAEMFSKRGIRLGIPVTVATAIVGTSISRQCQSKRAIWPSPQCWGRYRLGRHPLCAREHSSGIPIDLASTVVPVSPYESVRRSLDYWRCISE